MLHMCVSCTCVCQAAANTLAPWEVRFHRDDRTAERGLPEAWLALSVEVDGVPTVGVGNRFLCHTPQSLTLALCLS